MQNNKKVGKVLFKKIFVGYVLIATIFTSYHIYLEYSFAKESVLKEMKTIEKAFYNGITNSVWHLDQEQIDANARAIKSIHGIVGVSIISANKEVLAQKGNLSLKDKQYTTFMYEKNEAIIFSNGLIKHSFSIIHEDFSPGEPLGYVNLYTSESAIYAIVKNSLIYILIYNSMIIAVLWILFNYFSNKLLTEPLHQIIKATKDLSIKKYTVIELGLNNNDKCELDTLADTFNSMSKRIYESFTILKKQKKDLKEANRYQTDFLANISHELKTPLNSINTISAIMSKNSDHNLSEKQIKNIQIINKSGKSLLGLINDILNISKLEAGELSLNLEEFSIQDLLIDLYEIMSPLAKAKEIALTQKINLENNIIISDKKLIQHVIQNLLSNAIKFTHKGVIQLKISENEFNIIINIIDTGIGIPQNKLENIFDRFKQVDGSTTRKYGGTGLGLAISKDFSKFLNGELTVTSEINKGSNFQFSFPKESNLPKKQSLPKVSENSSSNKVKTEIEKLLENEENTVAKTTKKEKRKVILFNSNPIIFFSLIVAMKKQTEIDCITFTNVQEIIKELDLKQINILIVNNNDLDSQLKDHIKNNDHLKVIGLSDTEESNEYIDTIVPKSVNIETLLKLFS